MIKEFVAKNRGIDLLNQVARASDISEQQRKSIVNFLADYVVLLFGIQPTTSQMLKVAAPAIELVPALKSQVRIRMHFEEMCVGDV